MSHDMYSSPLASRYASDYMLHLFSDDSRYQTWRPSRKNMPTRPPWAIHTTSRHSP